MTTPANSALVSDADLIWQQCLFAFEQPQVDAGFAGLTRTWLDDESWVDYAPQWLGGADLVFSELVAKLPWRQREVTMYDKRVPEPRLTSWWTSAAAEPEPLPVLADAGATLTRQYSRPFDSIGFNLYRDGRDSVAWHADRERYHQEDPVVAIVSTGAPRAFHMRPIGGGQSRRWHLGLGDLFVMGGSCQHRWEHCVPKSASATGPRLSIMFRHNLADWRPPTSGSYNQGFKD
ncbi:MAG: alpha-ketoglutarate-dependent dioxygenase AlkB [Actinobacteria bacterium]|nr:alpha-ketoglutarate-dependent dioxygenase AlkB [Actinomycetota bacterium]